LHFYLTRGELQQKQGPKALRTYRPRSCCIFIWPVGSCNYCLL